MPIISFNLEPLLRQHGKNPSALVEASGLSKTTVYNIVNNKAKAVELETLEKLLTGLEKLTGQPLSFNDLFEKRSSSREERLARLLKDAKPFNWEETKKLLPELTPEEKEEGEDFIRTLEDLREQDRRHSLTRNKEWLELFEEESEDLKDAVTK
jgi:DNA-binding Xre family transcriptional regulator